MSDATTNLFSDRQGSNWIRLRTLIVVRWMAIAGQLAAITVAQSIYGLNLEMGLCYLVIGVSATTNLVALFVFPENRRLSEPENFLMVLFDLLQLALLLYLTGGLHNPFAILLLAPVVIAATVMSLRSVLIVGSTAIILATVLANYYVPLRTQAGEYLEVPEIFLFGHWAALVISVAFMSIYALRVTNEIRSMGEALAATQMALAREQKLTDLAGVVAAAAHELGTPLATIKLASAELADELADRPELREDAELIREQTDRCRDILRDMGRAGKDDLHLRQAPLATVLAEAAEPHMDRGKTIDFEYGPMQINAARQPSVLRLPGVIHGLRNLIQNAVDFADNKVWVETDWSDSQISVRIMDDGPGYPPHLIGRIGDPFVKQHRSDQSKSRRPGYEGMGLGLFIAKTLLERSGAELNFANGSDVYDHPVGPMPRARGAIVAVTWPRSKLDATMPGNVVPTGENPRFEA